MGEDRHHRRVGEILAEYLASDVGLQSQLRADPSLAGPAADEILRLHGPLVTNRRVTTCPVEIGGRRLRPVPA
ncbi:MAG: hypothetical protein R3D25_07070 [Geminicoccaceae bacterium]